MFTRISRFQFQADTFYHKITLGFTANKNTMKMSCTSLDGTKTTKRRSTVLLVTIYGTPSLTTTQWDVPLNKMSSKFVHRLWSGLLSTMQAMMRHQPLRAAFAVSASSISSRLPLFSRRRLAEHDASSQFSLRRQGKMSLRWILHLLHLLRQGVLNWEQGSVVCFFKIPSERCQTIQGVGYNISVSSWEYY